MQLPDWVLKIGTFVVCFTGAMVITMFLLFWVLPICIVIGTGAVALATGR